MVPIPFEHSRPLVQRPDGFAIGAIERLSALTANVNQADIQQHLEMLRRRWLKQVELLHDVADPPLTSRQKDQNVPSSRFGDGVEHIRGRGGSGHVPNYIPITEYVNAPVYSTPMRSFAHSTGHA